MLERPSTLPKTTYNDGGGGGGAGSGGGGDDGRGGTGGGGGGGAGDGGSGGKDNRCVEAEEKYTQIGMFAGKVLDKTLPGDVLKRFESNPFAKIGYIQVVREFLDKTDFPFRKAWNLGSKDLMFYITLDQVLDHKWNIEEDLFNDPKDEFYVMGNIIQDHADIGYMDKETKMKERNYCFVSNGKVIQYIGEKLKLNPEGQLEITDAAGPDLGRLGGMQ